jgi:hypothetical protein
VVVQTSIGHTQEPKTDIIANRGDSLR